MTDDLKERLLACPFCAAIPVLDYHDGDVISCRCGAVMEGRSSEVAIKAWNTRALDPRITDLEARLAAADKQRRESDEKLTNQRHEINWLKEQQQALKDSLAAAEAGEDALAADLRRFRHTAALAAYEARRKG